jgi:hypothetical protein
VFLAAGSGLAVFVFDALAVGAGVLVVVDLAVLGEVLG